MSNMAVNKVIYDGDTLIDLSGDTVTAAQLLTGVTAHDKAGNPITGTYKTPSGTVNITANGTHNVSSYATAAVNIPIRFFEAIITISSTSQIVVSGIPFQPLGYVAMPGNFATTRNYTFSQNQEIAFANVDGRLGIYQYGTNATYLVYPNWSVSGSGNNWTATITTSGGGRTFRSGVRYTFRFFGV